MSQMFTIGHSNHPIERLIELLEMHSVAVVADVRSSPYSKFNPQYNRENLQKTLKESGLRYVFLGRELGPRSEDPSCYENGKVQYARLASTDVFREGIQRLHNGVRSYRIALLCAEKDPVTCHRMILVCRALRADPIEIHHILEDGGTESLADSERRLILSLKMPQLRLGEKMEDLIQRAYDTQAQRIAYTRQDDSHPEDGEQDGDTWKD